MTKTESGWWTEGDRSSRIAERRAAITSMVRSKHVNCKDNTLTQLDNVFSPHDGNARVYDNAAKRLVRRVMEGYNGTVFAYGMTGTGKTFSMQGTANQPGTIPLAITDIFSYIRENPEREFLLRVSYLEIYNEKIFDLLNQSTPGTQQEDIKLREDSKRGVYASPLKEEIVQSPNQLLRVISRGDQARRTGSTQFNARSSRSHAVVQIVVESRERVSSQGGSPEKEARRSNKILPGGVLVSTLSLIDLAGSEKAAANKERRTEGSHINKSLLTLGTVIARLTGDEDKEDGAKAGDKDKSAKHLPYRDSKLTRLLQPALSGNSLVSILCTIQLSSAATSAATTGAHTGETLNTLKFASRAKNNIVSHAKKNESNTSGDPNSRALLDRYRNEIQELRAQLEAQSKAQIKAKEDAEEDEEFLFDRRKEEELERQERTRHEEQMLEMQLARTALKERIGHLNRLILSSKSLGVNSSGRFSSASMPLHRMSSMSHVSQPDFGRPVSLRSRDSLASHPESYRDSYRTSTQTLEVPNTDEHPLRRKVSAGSITMGVFPAAQTSQLAEESEYEDDSAGPGGDGEASLIRQNNMLQADLSDKNRYIATLEKRLLQARRSSNSRASMSFSNRGSAAIMEEPDTDALAEKDREIEELRAKLDDQTRMVQALRSATRKRETLEGGVKPPTAVTDASTQTTALETPLADHPQQQSDPSDLLSQLEIPRATSSRKSPSISSQKSNGSHHHQRTLSPVALLTPSRSLDSSAVYTGPAEHSKAAAAAARLHGATRRRSVDEMTALLDQMIADKVESGHLERGERGSLRAKRDTVMEKSRSLSPPIRVERPTESGAERVV
jgi:centromeric protein E